MLKRNILLSATIAILFSLIVVGAYVTVGGYGDACGSEVPRDWPLCSGGLLPPPSWGPIVEYAHRLLAAFSTLFLIVTTVVFWRAAQSTGVSRRILTAASVLLILQVLLGGVVVAAYLAPALVALHQAVAILIFGLAVAALSSQRRHD